MADNPSFEEAFRTLWPSCRATAEKILGPAGDPEDLAAEALARALVRWRRIKNLPYRDAWVLRVTVNLALDEVRRRRRSTTLVPASGDDLADASALRLDLVSALGHLPKRQREAVALRYLVGLSEREAAAGMGVTESTVKEHTQRAMATLRAQFGADLEEATLAI
jgi:RNA polymerase sigma-70 factor (ECF subfamily)